MRLTVNIDDELLNKASRLTGIKNKTVLVKLGLQTLIAQASSIRLSEMGNTENMLQAIPRRHPRLK